MAQYVYSFKSEAGTFWIRREKDGDCSLSIADDDEVETLGYYKSPLDVAEDVCDRQTGLREWDRDVNGKAPASLTDFLRTTVAASQPIGLC
jgi:hypothetical protein